MDLTETWEKLKALTKEAVHQGPITLASGKVSDFYIDGRQVTLRPEGAYYCALLMAEMLKDIDFDAVGGPTMGADPIVGALCYHLGARGDKAVTAFIIRKEVKGHGLQKLVEGPSIADGARIVIVEDVVTSGGSILKAVRAVEHLGCRVVKILALVDREQGAAVALSDYDFAAVFRRSELE